MSLREGVFRWMAAFLALQGVWGVLLAQEPPAGRLEVRSWQKRVVQGEILWLEGKLTWSQAVDLPGKLQGMDPNLWIEWTLPGGATRLEATGREPEVPWRGPAYRPERGCPEVVQISLWPCEPGTHRIRLRYRVSPEWQKRGSFWEGEVLSDWAEVEVTAPQEADAEVWKAYLALSPKMDCQRFYTWATYPSNGILAKFPTSTYAGYILRAPAASFGCSSYDCFENAEEALRTECNRGGGEEVVQRCMRNERQRMEAYARAARAFLEAHPDFWAAPRIRRELAFCLAFTGRLPEALEHVEILAQGEGKEAQEAKAYLGARERRGVVAQERRGENRRTASEADGR